MTNQEQPEQEQTKLQEKIKELQEELKQCEQEKEEYLSGWKRAKANFLNYKKEEQDRMEKSKQEAKRELIKEILPVLDSFDRAEKSEGLKEGVQQIKKELESVLVQEGVEKINTEQKFDPALHEAVEQIPVEQEQGTIIEEVKAGYKHKNKVIRAAKVKVAANEVNTQ